jgi:hypothetical protein
VTRELLGARRKCRPTGDREGEMDTRDEPIERLLFCGCEPVSLPARFRSPEVQRPR